jgi:hypothetical protein
MVSMPSWYPGKLIISIGKSVVSLANDIMKRFAGLMKKITEIKFSGVDDYTPTRADHEIVAKNLNDIRKMIGLHCLLIREFNLPPYMAERLRDAESIIKEVEDDIGGKG